MSDTENQQAEISIRSNREAEIASLAKELVAVYRSGVDYYHEQHKLELGEADYKARELLRNTDENAMADDALIYGPPQLTNWFELARLAELDPGQMLEHWQAINQAALDELLSGHHAAMSILTPEENTPQTRAQFLVLRASFIQEWGPRGGIELSLIDTMAQAQTLYHHWLGVLVTETGISTERRKPQYNLSGKPEAPRVSDAEAMELAAGMVDRFNRLFMRTLRQLRDLRRYTPPVTIQNAGQVNIANQQVNLANTQQEEGSSNC